MNDFHYWAAILIAFLLGALIGYVFRYEQEAKK